MTITIERRSLIQGVDLLPPQQQRWRQALHSPEDCRSQSSSLLKNPLATEEA